MYVNSYQTFRCKENANPLLQQPSTAYGVLLEAIKRVFGNLNSTWLVLYSSMSPQNFLCISVKMVSIFSHLLAKLNNAVVKFDIIWTNQNF